MAELADASDLKSDDLGHESSILSLGTNKEIIMYEGMTEATDIFQVGKKYKVIFNDCCVSGEFIATVTEVRRFEYDEKGNAPDEANSVTFDNSVVLTSNTIWDKLEVLPV